MSSTSSSMSPMTRAAIFGLEIGALAAVITAIVIYIKNDKHKNTVGYKPINLWKNVAIAGGLGAVAGFVLSELKSRIQQKKAYQAIGEGVSSFAQKWRSPATSTMPEVSSMSS